MPSYLFLIIVFACLVFHLLFGLSRKRRLVKLPLSSFEKRNIEQVVETNILFAVFTVGACFLIALIHLYIPDWHPLVFSFTLMNSKILNYIGIFLVKISFISNIVLYFQISDKFSFEFADLNTERIFQLEALVLFTNVLLSGGVFIYISNAFSFVVFLHAVCFFAYRKLTRNSRKKRGESNQRS
jgi:hypothetical protein